MASRRANILSALEYQRGWKFQPNEVAVAVLDAKGHVRGTVWPARLNGRVTEREADRVATQIAERFNPADHSVVVIDAGAQDRGREMHDSMAQALARRELGVQAFVAIDENRGARIAGPDDSQEVSEWEDLGVLPEENPVMEKAGFSSPAVDEEGYAERFRPYAQRFHPVATAGFAFAEIDEPGVDARLLDVFSPRERVDTVMKCLAEMRQNTELTQAKRQLVAHVISTDVAARDAAVAEAVKSSRVRDGLTEIARRSPDAYRPAVAAVAGAAQTMTGRVRAGEELFKQARLSTAHSTLVRQVRECRDRGMRVGDFQRLAEQAAAKQVETVTQRWEQQHRSGSLNLDNFATRQRMIHTMTLARQAQRDGARTVSAAEVAEVAHDLKQQPELKYHVVQAARRDERIAEGLDQILDTHRDHIDRGHVGTLLAVAGAAHVAVESTSERGQKHLADAEETMENIGPNIGMRAFVQGMRHNPDTELSSQNAWQQEHEFEVRKMESVRQVAADRFPLEQSVGVSR